MTSSICHGERSLTIEGVVQLPMVKYAQSILRTTAASHKLCSSKITSCFNQALESQSWAYETGASDQQAGQHLAAAGFAHIVFSTNKSGEVVNGDHYAPAHVIFLAIGNCLRVSIDA